MLGNNAPALFTLGTTPVTFTSTDDSGNASSCLARVTVVDTAMPAVSASLTPVGRIHKRTGSFRVGFSTTDNCEPAPSVLAVMAIPPGAEGFRVVLDDDDSDDDEDSHGEATITFDYGRRRVTLEGSSRSTLLAMLARILAEGGAAVAHNQVVRLELDEQAS